MHAELCIPLKDVCTHIHKSSHILVVFRKQWQKIIMYNFYYLILSKHRSVVGGAYHKVCRLFHVLVQKLHLIELMHRLQIY